MNGQWKEELRRKMEAHGEQPPPLDGVLRERANAALRHNAARHKAMIWTWRSAAAVAAIVVMAVMLRERPEEFRYDSSAAIGAPGNTLTASLAPTSEASERTVTTVGTAMPAADVATEPAATDGGRHADGGMADSGTDTNDTEQKNNTAGGGETTPDNRTRELQPRHGTHRQQPRLQGSATAKPSGIIALSAYMGNAATPSSRTMSSPPMLAEATPIGVFSLAMKGNDGGDPLPSPSVSETTVSHSQPVRVGMRVRYSRGRRWSVETGLTYSYLYSEITQRTAHYTHTTSQRLHYVGIPVGVGYTIVSGHRLSLYATAGAMAEKCVGGTASVSRPQYSVNAAIGAEFAINRSIGIYAEPGINHYFDNHGSTPTIYSDKPTAMSFNVGIRLNLHK